MKDTVCHAAWTCHLPSSGISSEPSGYRTAMTRAKMIPWAARTLLLTKLDDSWVIPLPEFEPDPDPLPPPVLAWVNGLESELTVAVLMSRLNLSVSSCWPIEALLLVVESEDPSFHALIQPVELVRDIVPPDHDSQLEHFTLAVMMLPLTPLPARRVSLAALLLVSSEGCVYRVPRRGDSVRLPFPSWYMRKMLEPDMAVPVPRATHSYDVGAEIWKYMLPDPDFADEDGTPMLKHTLLALPGQYFCVAPLTRLVPIRPVKKVNYSIPVAIGVVVTNVRGA